ncbi:EAL domain-containing protein [Rhodopseudomonas pseudopalustris]|uniref:EAL domain-containing protein n=1 Tax=Rhodopseudomonas pseudopalustris TaxID=1513892 RepID=UPI003F9667CD
MIRISTIFIAICMVLVSASLGMVLYSMARFSFGESAIVAMTVLTFMLLYNAVSMRLRERNDATAQIESLSRGTADLARQVAEFGRRLSVLESKAAIPAASNGHSTEQLQAVAGEIGELGTMVKHLASSVSAHEDLLMELAKLAEAQALAMPPAAAPAAAVPPPPPVAPAPIVVAPPPTAAPVAAPPVAPAPVASAPVTPPPVAQAPVAAAPVSMMPPAVPPTVVPLPMAPAAAAPAPAAPAVAAALPQPELVAAAGLDPRVMQAVQAAVEANRLDLYLQPIVSLPQRKVRFYEAVTRLRDADDKVLTAEQFIDAAESAGLMTRIDYILLVRCMQVLRRLLVRNKDVGVFCNIAAATLSDRRAFAQCLSFLEANRAQASSFVIEFKQSAFRSFGPVEIENLAALAQRGYRFSIDNVTDLRIEPRELADRGVRFFKVPAALLLEHSEQVPAHIHPHDLPDLLGRYGIDLIAERIEGERAVVDLLDYDVRFGQGFLFAAPRPLRPENPNPARPAPSARVVNTNKSLPSDSPRTEASRLTGNAALVRRAAGPY